MSAEGSWEKMQASPARQLPLIQYLCMVSDMRDVDGLTAYLQRVVLGSWLNLQSARAQLPVDSQYLHMMLDLA